MYIYMNLQIHNFTINNKIKKEYICTNHHGNNFSPKITWNIFNKAKSYALILEDPNAINGTFVHWYIPYISNNILGINKLNHNYNIKNDKYFIQGKNTLSELGYHGPCAPNKVNHNYIFIIYSLDGKLKINNDILSIKDHYNFEDILKNNKINILNKESKTFQYSYMNYYV